MPLVSALAIHDIEYSTPTGERQFVKAGVVIHDLTENECKALEALAAVQRLAPTSVPHVSARKKRLGRP